jgi:mutator protein MutT
MISKTFYVSCGIIRKDGKVLIAQRMPDSFLEADKWEFPGGKIEPGESPEQCLVREIKEELGISIGVDRLLTKNTHVYKKDGKDIEVHIHAFLADWLEGNPERIACQAFRWVDKEELHSFPFVEGDKMMIDLLLEDL